MQLVFLRANSQTSLITPATRKLVFKVKQHHTVSVTSIRKIVTCHTVHLELGFIIVVSRNYAPLTHKHAPGLHKLLLKYRYFYPVHKPPTPQKKTHPTVKILRLFLYTYLSHSAVYH